MFKRSQRGKAFAVIAAAGALSVTLAACGGSDDSSSDDAASDDTSEEAADDAGDDAGDDTAAADPVRPSRSP